MLLHVYSTDYKDVTEASPSSGEGDYISCLDYVSGKFILRRICGGGGEILLQPSLEAVICYNLQIRMKVEGSSPDPQGVQIINSSHFMCCRVLVALSTDHMQISCWKAHRYTASPLVSSIQDAHT